MNTNRGIGQLGAIVALLAVFSTQGQCQQRYATNSGVDFSAYEGELAALKSEVNALRAQVNHSQQSSCDSACFERCRSVPMLDVGTEIVFVTPHSTTGLGPDTAFFPSDELFPSWRAWVGFGSGQGPGIRIRYWTFDQQVTNSLNPFVYDLDTFVLDLELTYSAPQKLGVDTLWFGGVRHVGFDERRVIADPVELNVESNLTGLVVGCELRMNLIPCVRGYGILRGSAVYGDVDTNFGGVGVIDNTLSSIWETQLGVEAVRNTSVGELSFRLGVEGQYWDSITFHPGDSIGDGQHPDSIGFIGLATGLVLRR